MPLMHAASCGFEAARSVRNVADLRRCLHGHSFLCSVRWADGAPDMGAALSTALAPLDYADLNQAVAVPDDASLLGWIAGHLPHADGLWLRSAPDRGVLRASAQTPLLHWLHADFEAAHQLPNVPPGH